jgi:ribosome recycling factor
MCRDPNEAFGVPSKYALGLNELAKGEQQSFVRITKPTCCEEERIGWLIDNAIAEAQTPEAVRAVRRAARDLIDAKPAPSS